MKKRESALETEDKNEYLSTGNGKCCELNDDKTASCNSNLLLPY